MVFNNEQVQRVSFDDIGHGSNAIRISLKPREITKVVIPTAQVELIQPYPGEFRLERQLQTTDGGDGNSEIVCNASTVGVHYVSVSVRRGSEDEPIIFQLYINCADDVVKRTITEGTYKKDRAHLQNNLFRGNPRSSNLIDYSDTQRIAEIPKLLKEPTSPFRHLKEILPTGTLKDLCNALRDFVIIQAYTMERNSVMRNKTMTKDGSRFRLKVPGIEERRPSPSVGDSVCAIVRNESAGKEESLPSNSCSGRVVVVEMDHLLIAFGRSFELIFNEQTRFDISFETNWYQYFVQMRALTLIKENNELLQAVLMGTEQGQDRAAVTAADNDDDRFVDDNIRENDEQKEAVQNIVRATSRPSPYIIFGPPGTGKTVTIVEAIKQIRRKDSDAHILVCTPMNAAADLIVRMLATPGNPQRVLRLNATSRSKRDKKTIPDDILDYCFTGDYRTSEFVSAVQSHRVIVSTMITAARLITARFRQGYFSYLFIDEVGQAFIQEALVPIAGLIDPMENSIILAGDPRQLGPVVFSPLVKEFGFGESLITWLMDVNPSATKYKKTAGRYDSRYVTKLVRNYRSHEAILKVPNELFYDGQLRACAEMKDFLNYDGLPRKDFPIIFHGVTGQEMRESDSPSYYNAYEVSVVIEELIAVVKYARESSIKLDISDIGIITPYKKQVEKLRRAVADEIGGQCGKMRIGSVEEFQGSERQVIILSLVRSDHKKDPASPVLSRLGFMEDERRFNVAITRARALLIVVGDPYLFYQVNCWRRFLDHVVENGGYKGCTFQRPSPPG